MILVLFFFIGLIPSFCFEEASSFSDLEINEIFIKSPTDDPNQYNLKLKDYQIKLSPIFWPMIKGKFEGVDMFLPSKVDTSIEFFDQKIFLAFRNAQNHFPSEKSFIYVFSSENGIDWKKEWIKKNNLDLFNPRLIVFRDELHLYYCVGEATGKFIKPLRVEKVTKFSKNSWTKPVEVLKSGDVPFEFKVRNNLLWINSFNGEVGEIFGGVSQTNLQLLVSDNSVDFRLENEVRESVSVGGASETSVEFDSQGNLWGVSKNFEGDTLGFGSYLIYAPKNLLSYWTFKKSDQAYFSPKLFRFGDDFFLLAKRDLHNLAFDWFQTGPLSIRRVFNWSKYALGFKRTALYRLNKSTFELDWVMDLPGSGDTGEVSIRRASATQFLISNHSSSLIDEEKNFYKGLKGETNIYFQVLNFVPSKP